MDEKFDITKYESEGRVANDMVSLILAVGISIVIYIFVGVLAGNTYQLSSTQITGITNTTIKGYLLTGIGNGFSAYSTTGSYMPLIVLAVVISLVLTAVLGIGGMGGVGGAGAL